MLRQSLQSVFEGNSLSRAEAQSVMKSMMSDEASQEHLTQVAALIAALRTKGEDLEELIGFVTEVRRQAVPLQLERSDVIDTCGTGGDGAGTFNISTAVAMVVAASGVGVAKHGNRSVSSRCGSADVIEALGIRFDQSPAQIAELIQGVNFGFLFAPKFHPAFKNVERVRRALGVRTFFNLLGPLVNPAGIKRQVIGVYDPQMLETFAKILRELGSEEVMVVSSEDGLDEISLSAPTRVAHLKAGEIRTYSIDPTEFGLARVSRDHLKGGDAQENAQIIQNILLGRERGPRRDIVLLNAAAAFLVAGKVSAMKEGLNLAAEIIDSGTANDHLILIRAGSRRELE